MIDISALVEVNNNGLPQDFSKIKSKESFLKPFPVKEIMKMAQKSFMRYGIGPDDEIYFDDLFNVLTDLYQYSDSELVFGDWKYNISSFYDYNGETIVIETRAQKMNTKMKLNLGKKIYYEWELIDLKDGLPKAKYYLELLYKYFEEVRENIVQWNKISANSKPIINERPPYEDLIEEFEEEFYEQVVEEEWLSFKVDYQDREEFIKHHGFWLGFVFHYVFYDVWFSFGDRPRFNLRFEPLLIEDGSYSIITAYISIENVNVDFIVYEEEFNLTYEEIYASEIVPFLEHIVEDINQSVVQWNQILEGG